MIRSLLAFIFSACLVGSAAAIAPATNTVIIAPGAHTFTVGWNQFVTPTTGALLSAGHLNATGGVSSGGVVLTRQGVIRSISVYCTVCDGNILLGFYDNSGPTGYPGNMMASTASTPLHAGWNTIKVTAPVLLQSGTYWFQMIVDSNTSQLGTAPGTAGHLYILNQQYAMPPTAPVGFNPDTPIITAYATFSTSSGVPAVPVSTAAPTISGTAQVGQTLTGTNGIWTNNPASYRYMWTWEDCGTDNTRTAITTVPGAADVGHQLCFSVWARNASGESVRVEAALTATVTANSGILTAANFANSGVRGFNQPGVMTLASFQDAASFGAKVMRVFINGTGGGNGGGTGQLSNNGSQYTIGGGAPGTFDFTMMDGIVSNAQTAGLKIIWTIDDGKVLSTSTSLQNSFVAMWQAIATHYNGNATIAGYDLWNEPVGPGGANLPVASWIPISQNAAAAIRAVDPNHVILWESTNWGSAYGYDQLAGTSAMPLASYTNVVYEYHNYDPNLFCTQTTGSNPYGVIYPNTSLSCFNGGTLLNWNSATLGPDQWNCDGSGRHTLLDLQATFGFQILAGEFSAVTMAPTNNNGHPSATDWVNDTITYMRSKNVSWLYHSWNEWWGWDPEVSQTEAIRLMNGGAFPVARDPNSATSLVLKNHFAEP